MKMPAERSHNLQRALLVTVIVAFGAFTVIAVVNHGVVGFIEKTVENTATLQVLIDLSIVATLALIWMYRDSRTSNTPFIPYALLTIAAGSFGPLSYLLHRTWKV
jgi:uncharacterized membrane protein YqjE